MRSLRWFAAAFGFALAVTVLAVPVGAADKFVTYAIGLNSPYTGGFAVTKSDSTVFSQPTRGVWVGGTGDLAVRYIDGTTDTIQSVPAGVFLPIRVDKVLSTGTTATKISGVY